MPRNGFIDSFNGRLHDNCLNGNQFTNFSEARHTNEAGKIDYNNRRPLSSLNGFTPPEFAARPI